ncbi:MAG: hypothetical protein ABL860_07445 [Candidatus Nitrotoga sp.]
MTKSSLSSNQAFVDAVTSAVFSDQKKNKQLITYFTWLARLELEQRSNGPLSNEVVGLTAARFYERRLKSLEQATASMSSHSGHHTAQDVQKFIADFTDDERSAMRKVLGPTPSRRDLLRLTAGTFMMGIGTPVMLDGVRRVWITKPKQGKTLSPPEKESRIRDMNTGSFEFLLGAITGSIGSALRANASFPIRVALENAERPEKVVELAGVLVQQSNAVLNEILRHRDDITRDGSSAAAR